MKRIYEFLLWDNCNNNCQFCWQRENPRIYNKMERGMVLRQVLEFIKSDRFEKGSHILVCGGEIFDKPSDFNDLDVFFSTIVHYMKSDIIELFYINIYKICVNI